MTRSLKAGLFALSALMFCGAAGPLVEAASARTGAATAQSEKERLNQNTVTIVSGNPNGTYLQIAYDLSAVLDDEDRLRVMPVVGKGSAQNIRDILFLKGVDMGITQTTDLARIKREQPDIANRLVYLTKLYNEEVHVLARPDIKSLKDLEGKAVNFSDVGGGTQFVARELFEKSGVSVQEVNMGQADAIEKMRSGEVAATVFVAGKPGSAFAKAPRDAGFHFLPIPYGPNFQDSYYPAELDGNDYPGLVAPGQRVPTIAVGAVLVAFNWPEKTDRYQRLQTFTEALFSKFEGFQQAPRHPKWREVNLAAEVPGWPRFAPAQKLLQRPVAQAAARGAAADASLRSDFDRYIRDKGVSAKQREQMFEEFLQWRGKK